MRSKGSNQIIESTPEAPVDYFTSGVFFKRALDYIEFYFTDYF